MDRLRSGERDRAGMRLAADGMALTLAVARYQFPNDRDGGYDANWLLIDGAVEHPRGGWRFRDPCLLTDEAAALGDWLAGLADGIVGPPMTFIEPNLGFAVDHGGAPVLNVRLALEARPPWAARGASATLALPLAALDLGGAVGAWRAQLTRYPPRRVEP